MSTKVSALTQLNASATTFTYGITNASTDGKVAIGAVNGLPIFDASGNILATASGVGTLGTQAKSFAGVFLSTVGTVNFVGSAAPNTIGYTDGVGPFFNDGQTGNPATFNVQALTLARTYTLPNVTGTVTVLGNTSNAASGFVIFDSSSNIAATAAGTGSVGTTAKPFAGMQLSAAGSISYKSAGGGNFNTLTYTDGNGLTITDGTTLAALFLNVQSLTANRQAIFPDTTGVVALQNTISASPPVATPTTGQTVNVVANGLITCELIEPAGALAALTITASNASNGGQIIYVTINQSITTLTVSGANFVATALPLPTSVTASATFGFVWDATASKWNRFL